MIGPILGREWLVAPRRWQFYMQRVVFVAALFSLVGTVWLLLAGMQQVRNVGDLARFRCIGLPASRAAGTGHRHVSRRGDYGGRGGSGKDRRTLVLLLLTRLRSSEIVLGKLVSSLLSIGNMVLSTMPLLLVFPLLGGVSIEQAMLAMLVILVTAFWCGSLGALIGFWREKTFQALAITLLAIAAWCVFGEAIAGGSIPQVPTSLAKIISPSERCGAFANLCPIPHLQGCQVEWPPCIACWERRRVR